MSRVPCSICGLEVLPATAERNHGLCGRCVKGARPCIYCRRHVAEPLQDGIWAHVECSIRKRHEQESLGWKTASDIDWQWIRQLLHTSLRRLFDRVVIDDTRTAAVSLCFHIHVENFADISVHQIEPDGSKKRLSDSDWDGDLSPLDSSFFFLHEKLSGEEQMKLSENMEKSLTNILSDECKDLEKHNFKYAKAVSVSWVIRCA
jgi:hypothetical protein